MERRTVVSVIALAAGVVGVVMVLRRDHSAAHYTGFVEGEERVLRAEVAGRVLEVRYGEGAVVPANSGVAVLDDQEIASRIRSKKEELQVVDADIRTQEERIELVESTWKREFLARGAELRQAQAASDLAAKTYMRERALVETGVSSAQRLDETRSLRDQAHSALERAREMLARAKAEERTIALARRELAALGEKRSLATAQLGELEVTRSKYVVRSPAVPTVVQTQLLWPGEFAQPGTAVLAVLDPADKYVQIYVPVSEVGGLRIGQRVQIELDSRPGSRVAGEVSFIAERASFTPEKIETRSDRLGQVYRAKVRILERVEELQPGTEGNVYLVEGGAAPASSRRADAQEETAG